VELNKIYQHNVLDPWPFPDKSVNCIITSPPYWNLRNYNVEGQIGLEKTPEEFIDKMVKVFREAWRVLRDDGTLWINIGDCYAAKGKKRTQKQATAASTLQGGLDGQCASLSQQSKIVEGIKAKDLVGIPWMLAFALRADGWYLRQDIIWHKPNPMPESATDRCTRAHEYLFMFSKSSRYYYDAYSIKTPLKDKTYTTFGIESSGHGDGSGLVQSENWAKDVKVRAPKQWKMPDGWCAGAGGHGSIHRNGRESGKILDKQRGHGRRHAGFYDRWDHMTVEEQQSMGANKRSVWTVATAGYDGDHYATFPEALIVDPIKAGCPPYGIVLDPFMGRGTTGLVAGKNSRYFLGLELNGYDIGKAEERLFKEGGIFCQPFSI
jgi:site-specific DNA-methyltransferase (adenine-specific)